jgi:hypothetical protein
LKTQKKGMTGFFYTDSPGFKAVNPGAERSGFGCTTERYSLEKGVTPGNFSQWDGGGKNGKEFFIGGF